MNGASLGLLVVVAVIGFVGVPLGYAWASHTGALDRWTTRAADWMADHPWAGLWVRAWFGGAGALSVLAAVVALWHVLFPPGPDVSAWVILVVALLYGLVMSLMMAAVGWALRRRSGDPD